MPRLERLEERHSATVLRFELENRVYFSRSVPDRGDEYFAEFAARHAALLAEQAAGRCHFHVMVDDKGEVLARVNLVDVADGCAELGYRVAERAAGHGLAKECVRQVCALAGGEYQLRQLVASASLENAASLAVLRGTGFVPTGEVVLGGYAGVRHLLELTSRAQSADLPVRPSMRGDERRDLRNTYRSIDR